MLIVQWEALIAGEMHVGEIHLDKPRPGLEDDYIGLAQLVNACINPLDFGALPIITQITAEPVLEVGS